MNIRVKLQHILPKFREREREAFWKHSEDMIEGERERERKKKRLLSGGLKERGKQKKREHGYHLRTF